MSAPRTRWIILTSSALLVAGAGAWSVFVLAAPAESAMPQSAAFSRPFTHREILETVERARSALDIQAAEESAAAQKELPPLPQGISYPDISHVTDLDDTTSDFTSGFLSAKEALSESQVVYEEGYFASLTAIDWKCAWISQAVASQKAGDTTGTRKAIDTLKEFSNSELSTHFVDWESYVLPEIVEPIAEGKTALALNYLNSCLPETRVDTK